MSHRVFTTDPFIEHTANIFARSIPHSRSYDVSPKLEQTVRICIIENLCARLPKYIGACVNFEREYINVCISPNWNKIGIKCKNL